ncbi:MFS transporter [Thiotrichales bacterium 19S3-7]|nr:MFS transporter [Thiotrichales bacterium 19S3-7]MCF6800792.1 MFS transporter [Thiotrichales bacterium 19S3-11]
MHNLLRRKRFLPLFIVQFLQAVNDNLVRYAFIVLLTFTTSYQSSKITALNSIAIALFIFPYFILSALAGELADKCNKAIIIRWVKCVEILVMVLVAIGFYLVNIPLLLFSIFLLGVHSTIFGPIKYAILPQHLQKHELVAGNALIESGTFFAVLIGILLGSQLYPLAFGREIVVILGFSLAITGLFVSFYVPQAKAMANQRPIQFNIIHLTIDIIYQAYKNKAVFIAILGISWFWFVAGCYMSLFPEYVKSVLFASHHVFNYFIILFSIGIAIGTLITSRLQKGEIHARYVPFALILMSVSMFLFFCVNLFLEPVSQLMSVELGLLDYFHYPIFWFISLMILLIAVFGGIYTVPLYAMVQHLSDQKMCARMVAANNMINAFFLVVMSVFISLWVHVLTFSIISSFLALAVINLLVVLLLVLFKIKRG